MNTQSLKTNKKMLAMILGVAIVASVGGSLAYAQTTPVSGSSTTPTPIQGSINLPQMILSNVKVSFTSAASTAAGQVTNGQVLGGGLKVVQGSVVYVFKVTDGKSVYSVIVDAGNGSVLKTSQGHPLTLGSILGGMGGGMRMHGQIGMMHPGSWAKSPTSGSSNSGSSSGNTVPGSFQD